MNGGETLWCFWRSSGFTTLERRAAGCYGVWALSKRGVWGRRWSERRFICASLVWLKGGTLSGCLTWRRRGAFEITFSQLGQGIEGRTHSSGRFLDSRGEVLSLSLSSTARCFPFFLPSKVTSALVGPEEFTSGSSLCPLRALTVTLLEARGINALIDADPASPLLPSLMPARAVGCGCEEFHLTSRLVNSPIFARTSFSNAFFFADRFEVRSLILWAAWTQSSRSFILVDAVMVNWTWATTFRQRVRTTSTNDVALCSTTVPRS